MISETIRLTDGRGLGIATVGQPQGRPIFHFHSRGLCRLEVLFLASSADRLGVRLIGVDRPGVGLSDSKAGYRIIDWPDDIAAAANHLGLKRFAVQGLSAGAAYALACAWKIPDRLTNCGLISAVSPGSHIRKSAPLWKRAISWTLARQPWLARAVMRSILPHTPDRSSIDKIIGRFERMTTEPDRRLLREPECRIALVRGLAEGLRQGNAGNVEDIMRQVGPWGFSLEAIDFDRIFLWHGSADQIVPVTGAHAMARALPNCATTIFPGEGHFSVLINRADDILTQLRS